MRLTLGITALLLVVTTFGAGEARAQGMSAQCTVTEILATSDKKGLDPKLQRYKAQLGQPVFKTWNTFTLLGEHDVTIERQKPSPVKIDNGTVTLVYKDKLIEEGGKARVRVGVEFDDKSGTRIFSTLVTFGGPTSFGGTPYKGGTHFVFLACGAK
jgi:hypothetical protein